MRSINTIRGFSLIEMLIYVAILVIFSGVVVATVLSLADTFHNVRVSRNVQTAAMVSLERISRDIRNSDSIVVAESSFDVDPGRLTLLRDLSGGGTEKTEFFLSSSTLHVRLDGVDEGSLTPSTVSVESLIFRQAANDQSSGVRIELTVKSARGKSSITKSFNLFVILRGSYQ